MSASGQPVLDELEVTDISNTFSPTTASTKDPTPNTTSSKQSHSQHPNTSTSATSNNSRKGSLNSTHIPFNNLPAPVALSPSTSANSEQHGTIRARSATTSIRKRSTSSTVKHQESFSLHPTLSESHSGRPQHSTGLTLWQLLKIELDLNSSDPAKENLRKLVNNDTAEVDSQALLNFVKLPLYLENFMTFGMFYCTVVFLKWTIMIPLRSILHFYSLIRSLFLTPGDTRTIFYKFMKHKNDFLSIFLVISSLFLLRGLDSSKIYHNIRAGTAVKLYFMVGSLEIADKLLSSSGQDITKLLFHMSIFKSEGGEKEEEYNDDIPNLDYTKTIHFILLVILSVCYLVFHSYVMVFQIMALNVAINSYSNALLTLILSAQFAELKSAVFKKTEREGLFQITCADLNERFQLMLTLLIVSSRNLFQLFTSGSGLSNSMKPRSWYSHLTFSKQLNDWIGFLMGPIFIVIGSEILVDWMKHSYISKYNKIKPKIYRKYMRVLAVDYVDSFRSVILTPNGSSSSSSSSQQSSTAADLEYPDMLSKRTGLPIFAIIVVFYKMTVQPWLKHYLYSEETEEFSYITLIVVIVVLALLMFVRLILSLILLKWSNKILRQKNTYKPLADYVPGAPNVSLSDVNSARKMLYDQDENVPPSLEEIRINKAMKKTNDNLENVTRFEMADKRIW